MKPVKAPTSFHSFSVQYTTTKPSLLSSLLRRRRLGANQRATAASAADQPLFGAAASFTLQSHTMKIRLLPSLSGVLEFLKT
ncbi:hypothetical protein Hanom_Chr09g00854801 [Helianthus anomalus]